MRESPATDIMSKLMSLGAAVSFHDKLNPVCHINDQKLESISLNKNNLEEADCVVLISPHSDTNIEDIVNHSQLLVDTRNKTKGFKKSSKKELSEKMYVLICCTTPLFLK